MSDEPTLRDTMPPWATAMEDRINFRLDAIGERVDTYERNLTDTMLSMQQTFFERIDRCFDEMKAHNSATANATQENSRHLAKMITDSVDEVTRIHTHAVQLRTQLDDVQEEVGKIRRKVAPNGNGG